MPASTGGYQHLAVEAQRCSRILFGRHYSSYDDGWEATVSLAMTKQERETFLADLHVGIISIPEEGRGPLTVPIWYSYEPGGELRVVTARTSRKAQLLQHAGRFSVCVQTETSYCQVLWIERDQAAAFFRFFCCGSICTPSSNTTPARTSGTSSAASMARQWPSATLMSLNAMVSPAVREPAPLVTPSRRRTVAKLDSIGLVVRRCFQCAAG